MSVPHPSGFRRCHLLVPFSLLASLLVAVTAAPLSVWMDGSILGTRPRSLPVFFLLLFLFFPRFPFPLFPFSPFPFFFFKKKHKGVRRTGGVFVRLSWHGAGGSGLGAVGGVALLRWSVGGGEEGRGGGEGRRGGGEEGRRGGGEEGRRGGGEEGRRGKEGKGKERRNHKKKEKTEGEKRIGCVQAVEFHHSSLGISQLMGGRLSYLATWPRRMSVVVVFSPKKLGGGVFSPKDDGM